MALVNFPVAFLGNAPATDLTALQTADAAIHNRMAVTELRRVIDAGAAYHQTINAIADEFSDETGIDTSSSLNEVYDTSGDFYTNANAGTSTVNAIPAMTSDTEPSGVVSQTGGGAGAYIFYDRAYSIGAFGSPYGFVQYDFGSGNGKVIKQYKIGARNDYTSSAPRAWTFQGSNDNSTWTIIDTQANQSFGGGELKVYNVSNSTNYRYYRNNFTQTNGHANMTWNSIEMYAALAPVNMTIISNAFTAESEPSTARLVLLHQPVDAVALGTDFTAEVSIDGGTTFDAVTLSDLGEFSTGVNILAGTVNVSARTGTSLKYRLTTLNIKEQKIHGTWLQWS